MNIGILSTSEIACRRFLPALSKLSSGNFIGMAVADERERKIIVDENCTNYTEKIINSKKKAIDILNTYDGILFNSYEELINSSLIDSVYIPLPPALHYYWAKKSLEAGKNVLLEKPFTINSNEAFELVRLAKVKRLSLHENYMFAFHKQLAEIKKIIDLGEIGDVRLYRISFGFPMRKKNDFRYNLKLGGGALLDAGGYTLKYASMVLGETTSILYATLNSVSEFDVDMYGSAALCNDYGDTVQVAFGMDNDYKCELEVWGSKGTLNTNRILTAPVGYKPILTLSKGNTQTIIELSEDDAFYNSICYFNDCIKSEKIRNESYRTIEKQAKLLDAFYMKLKG